MNIQAFYDDKTSTLTYIVWDVGTNDAVILDPVLDYDPASSMYSYESIDKLLSFVELKKLKVQMILETHAHADHLSGSHELKKRISGVQVAIGEEITRVQQTFSEMFNFPEEFRCDGSQFDRLIKDGERFSVGSLKIQAIHTPGHTEACYSYLIDDAVFTGDALFMPDFGVGRCDFPNGSAKNLYKSVSKKLYELPDATRVFTGHDYQPGGRALRYESTIGEEKQQNIQLSSETSESDFIRFRTSRDKVLAAPKLLIPSVQVNINAGQFPSPESNGISYLKFPVRYKNG